MEFCASHALTLDRLYASFAEKVAIDFVEGCISFAEGDAAMNQLWSASGFGLNGFAMEIYLVFDAGEFYRTEDAPDVVPWQKYTLPAVMAALAQAGAPPGKRAWLVRAAT